MVVWGWGQKQGMTMNKHKETFRGGGNDGTALELDYGDGYITSINLIFSRLDCTVTMGDFWYEIYTSTHCKK